MSPADPSAAGPRPAALALRLGALLLGLGALLGLLASGAGDAFAAALRARAEALGPAAPLLLTALVLRAAGRRLARDLEEASREAGEGEVGGSARGGPKW